MWTWRGKAYLGAAHGVAGILYSLLCIGHLLDDATLNDIRQVLDYGIRNWRLPRQVISPLTVLPYLTWIEFSSLVFSSEPRAHSYAF